MHTATGPHTTNKAPGVYSQGTKVTALHQRLPNATKEGGLRLQGQHHAQTQKAKPVVSIITICYNAEKYLEQTIISVLGQTYENIEYILIDGGSEDRSLSIISKYENRISYWGSSPDEGISDAFNKGLSLASGQIIGLLNAGDLYSKQAVQHVVNAHLKAPCPLTYGNTQLISPRGRKTAYIKAGPWTDKHKGTPFMHSACFVTRGAYEQIGGFDTSLRIAMDIDLLYRLHGLGEGVKVLNKTLSFQRTGGLSHKNALEGLKEYHQLNLTYSNLPEKELIEIYKKRKRRQKLQTALKKTGLLKPMKKITLEAYMFVKGMYLFTVNSIVLNTPFMVIRKPLYRLLAFGGRLPWSSNILAGARVLNPRGVSIGNNSRINRGCLLDGRGSPLNIGDNVDVATGTIIWTLSHDIDDPQHGVFSASVHIENHAWLGCNSVIMPGVRIGKGAVVAAGSVVNKDVPPKAVVGGVPAKEIKQRDNDLEYCLRTTSFWQ